MGLDFFLEEGQWSCDVKNATHSYEHSCVMVVSVTVCVYEHWSWQLFGLDINVNEDNSVQIVGIVMCLLVGVGAGCCQCCS